MAPIHDTDIAEKRWLEAEWSNYELWEKVEQRLRRRRLMWIGATVAAFLVLSAVPTVMDRWPKWTALTAARRLGQTVNRLKRDASIDHAAYRIRFPASGAASLAYVIERSSSCSDTAWTPVREGALLDAPGSDGYQLVRHEVGQSLNVPGLVDAFCYDYLAGGDMTLRGENLSGFGIIPVNDLSERRTDRLALLLLSGPSAEVSFD